MTHCILGNVLRKEQRNKQARVLAALQAPSLTKWREFRWSWKQNVRNLICFPNFPVTSNIFSFRHFSANTHFFHKPFLHILPVKLHGRSGKPFLTVTPFQKISCLVNFLFSDGSDHMKMSLYLDSRLGWVKQKKSQLPWVSSLKPWSEVRILIFYIA